MILNWKAHVGLLTALFVSSANATLVGSLHMRDNQANTTDQQSYSGLATRTTDGMTVTRGAVAGTISIMGGHELGNSSYTGVDISSYSSVCNFNDLHRYGANESNKRGGLVVWDFDLSTYLSGKTVGVAEGNSMFSLDVAWKKNTNSAGDPNTTGDFYISYNGDGLSLDAGDITTHTISGDTSGKENYSLVTTATAYAPVTTLAMTEGTASIDLTSKFSTIAAGDGKIRIAFIQENFYDSLQVQNASGIVETIAIPEPATLGMIALFGGGVLFIRRRFMI